MCPILSNFTPATLEFVWHIKSKIMRNTRIDRRGLQRNSWLIYRPKNGSVGKLFFCDRQGCYCRKFSEVGDKCHHWSILMKLDIDHCWEFLLNNLFHYQCKIYL